MCFSRHRRSLAAGCPAAAQRSKGVWGNCGFSLLVGVSKEQLSRQWVQDLHMGGHVDAGLASRSPHCKLGRGVGWQHDHGQENRGPQYTPSEHGERQREKRGSMCWPLWSSSWTCYPKGRCLPNQALWETPDSWRAIRSPGLPCFSPKCSQPAT